MEFRYAGSLNVRNESIFILRKRRSESAKILRIRGSNLYVFKETQKAQEVEIS
jgi:hypothetical protein